MRVRNFSPESPPLGAGLRKPQRFSRQNSYSFLAELVEGGTVDRGEVESVAGYFRMY